MNKTLLILIAGLAMLLVLSGCISGNDTNQSNDLNDVNSAILTIDSNTNITVSSDLNESEIDSMQSDLDSSLEDLNGLDDLFNDEE